MPSQRPVFFFVFFFVVFIPCGIENPYVRKHHMHLTLCKSELVKYIFFLVLSSIRTRNLPFSGPADCKFVHVHLNVLA